MEKIRCIRALHCLVSSRGFKGRDRCTHAMHPCGAEAVCIGGIKIPDTHCAEQRQLLESL